MPLETLLTTIDTAALNLTETIAQKLHLTTDTRKKYASFGLYAANIALLADLYRRDEDWFSLSCSAAATFLLPSFIKFKDNLLQLSIQKESTEKNLKTLEINPLRIYRKTLLSINLLFTGLYISIALSNNFPETNREYRAIENILSLAILTTIAYLNSPPKPTSFITYTTTSQPLLPNQIPKKNDEWIHFD